MSLNFTNFNTDIQSQPQMLTFSANVNNNISGVDYFDIYLGSDGNLSTSNNQQAVMEACAEAANTLLGEVVLDINVGIPYFQVVWNGVPNLQQFEAALKSAFLAVGGGDYVTGVPSLIVSINGSTLTYTAIIQTIYGVSNLINSVTGTTSV